MYYTPELVSVLWDCFVVVPPPMNDVLNSVFCEKGKQKPASPQRDVNKLIRTNNNANSDEWMV